jgi:hypothetical protein
LGLPAGESLTRLDFFFPYPKTTDWDWGNGFFTLTRNVGRRRREKGKMKRKKKPWKLLFYFIPGSFCLSKEFHFFDHIKTKVATLKIVLYRVDRAWSQIGDNYFFFLLL